MIVILYFFMYNNIYKKEIMLICILNVVYIIVCYCDW